MKKRGLSQIVSVVLLILIFIVAVSIIFVMLNPLLQEPSNSVVVQSLSVYLEIVEGSVIIDSDSVTLSIRRNPGGGQITDIKVILEDSTGRIFSADSGESINELETKRVSVDYDPLSIGTIERIAIAPVFLINGEHRLGDIADTRSITEEDFGDVPDDLPGPIPEPDPESPAHFDFLFTDQGLLKELNWTNHQNISKRVIRSEKGLFQFNAGVDMYLHNMHINSTNYHSELHYIDEQGNKISPDTTNQNYITYEKISETDEQAIIKATTSFVEITDTWNFGQDTLYIDVQIKNLLDEKITAYVPVMFGGLQIGNLDVNGSIVRTDTQITRLKSWLGGAIGILDNNGAPKNPYPNIGSFSPVVAMWDDDLTFGLQYITEIDLPEYYEFNEKAYEQFTPSIRSFISTELAPGQTKTYRVVIRLANGNDWQKTLEPYKNWFYLTYGDTPSYCPTGPVAWGHGPNFGWNNGLYIRDEQRFAPGTILQNYPIDTPNTLFKSSVFNNIRSLNLTRYGMWRLTLHSTYLSPNCPVSGTSGGACEHNPNIELIDPNLDAGRDPSKINDFVQQFNDAGAEVFWFARPCTTIYGANISYHDNGDSDWTEGEDYTIIPGMYSGTKKVDLLNQSNVDMNIERMKYFTSKGVTGFYLDQNGCPGDFEFIDTIYDELGEDTFLFTEGAVDRSALKSPQVPLIRNDTPVPENSHLLFWLLPNATYYGGVFNDVLAEEKIDQIINRGYQPIIDGSLANSVHLPKWKNWICQSYQNELARYESYGENLGCSPPILPSYC